MTSRAKTPTRRAFLLFSLVSLGASSAPRAPERESLFVIERSTNKNVVLFEARLRSGRLDPERPVHAYWRLFAEDGRREELTWLEKQFAYGYSVRHRNDGFVLELTALASRTLKLSERDGRYRATLSIAGRTAVLHRVWVQAEGALFGPRVRWVDVFGTDVNTGKPVAERISNE
ncbi:MAG TPA: DUF4833 domain-containing protein [Polyangiaceae bacterium]|nr:DUF4833 domain-containing protein [Polyangiaceae bacterium]